MLKNDIIQAWLFGDPHINTLDGKQYTFNGYGEYVLMKIDTEDKQFELQARTDLAEGANGTTINATVFSAFAARDDTGSFVQVELSRLKDSKLSGQIPDQPGNRVNWNAFKDIMVKSQFSFRNVYKRK